MKPSPTTKQKAVLDAIDDHMKRKGFPPTYTTLSTKLGISKGCVWSHLKLLEKKGHLTWNHGESNSLRRVNA